MSVAMKASCAFRIFPPIFFGKAILWIEPCKGAFGHFFIFSPPTVLKPVWVTDRNHKNKLECFLNTLLRSFAQRSLVEAFFDETETISAQSAFQCCSEACETQNRECTLDLHCLAPSSKFPATRRFSARTPQPRYDYDQHERNKCGGNSGE